jgi:protocatechuate 3,4-dioxygenase beta subunit
MKKRDSTARKPTAEQPSGPFYPVTKPADRDSDLTTIHGRTGRAKGQVIYVTGRVLNTDGVPLSGAQLEIWQANSAGRYIHPEDTNPAPLDPDFQGYGTQITDAGGKFTFKTVKPGAYPATKDWTRPPHIHFIVTGKSTRLVTQMYFQGEPLNEKDRLFGPTRDKDTLLTKLAPPTAGMEPGALKAAWDIVFP